MSLAKMPVLAQQKARNYSQMKRIRTAVVGVGYLGKYHAEKYATLPQSELVAICDINLDHAKENADKYDVAFVQDYKSLLGQVDAVSISVPTPLHHQVASFFLDNGIHTLIEKPIATTLEEADDLIARSKRSGAMIQVGHLERFNNAIKGLSDVLTMPRFIESVRTSRFKLRGSDVNVILDVMIHDIDIIQSLVKSEITDIRANGASVVSNFIDLATARIEFANGCAANVSASRVSLKTQRQLRIFQPESYIALDLDRKRLAIHRKGSKEMFPGIPEITREHKRFDKGDALLDQIDSFLNSIIYQTQPVVSGEDGRQALKTAIDITQIVKNRNESKHTTV